MNNTDIGIEDIELELSGNAALDALSAGMQRLAERHGADIEAHAADRSRRRSARSGSLLAASRFSPPSRSRYAALLFFETQLSAGEGMAELDRSMLVLSGCQILEEQLRNQLVPIAQRGYDQLLRALGDERSAGVFRAWHDEAVPVTIGVLHVMLMALRRALAHAPVEIAPVLHGPFTRAYDAQLASKGFEKSLGHIRNTFRNPLAHGMTTVDAGAYGKFCALLVGAPSVSSWDTRGPSPDPPAAQVALLHHHLSCASAPGE